MPKEIIVNSTLNEVRVAILENGNPAEIYVERAHSKNVAGNIYKGRVIKVLPGIQSAFVDVGLPKAAFLPAADVYVENGERVSFLESSLGGGERDIAEVELNGDANDEPKEIPPIEDMLKEGQEIIVQVAKESIGQKGARLTTHLTVPGRYIVLMPGYEHVGVSRKIEEDEERERLRKVLKNIKTPNMGIIARTVSAGHDEEELRADFDYLSRLWSKIREKMSAQSPHLIYEDHGLIFRILRDAATADVSKIVIDNKADFLKVKSFLREFLPDMHMEVALFTNDIPIFDYYNIEIEIGRILDKKVWLKSGGYIIIDQAEALTVIDVNTGKFVGKRNFEDTILKTNLESSKEIAWQLKLRNIGGIIIVDFIDMAKEENKQKVLKALENDMKNDRAKASVVNISPLGLVEITRKRVQESLSRTLSEACPYCEGRGLVKSKLTICYDILREVRRIAPFVRNKRILIEAHPDVVDLILDEEKQSLDEIELMMSVNVEAIPNDTLHIHDYEVTPIA